MDNDSDTSMFAMSGGCPVHGDDFIQECSICGQEYCAKCHPGKTCPDCSVADDEELEDDLLDDEPREDRYLDALIDDEELENLLKEGEELPRDDIMDDDLR